MRIALTVDRDASEDEESDYVRALMGAGFRREEIVILPPDSPVGQDFDGVVLGGGGDVDPSLYGQAPRADANLELDPGRDRTDLALFDRARRCQAPTLAICRGLQVVNVALGGTLIQDLPTERPSGVVHQIVGQERNEKRLDHLVRIAPGSRLSAIAATHELAVNSRHHQAIDRTAPGLTASARAPDGVIEALEQTEPWLLAVQWHPENLIAQDAASRRIFEEFARAVRSRAPVTRD